MENLSFVLWMVLWPLTGSVEKYIKGRITGQWDEPTFAVSIIMVGIWVFVAALLYKK